MHFLPTPPPAKQAIWRFLAALLTLTLPIAARAQVPAASTDDARVTSLLQNLNQVRVPTAVAISPDGTNLAWAANGAQGSELHLTGIAPAGSAQDGAWERVLSPDTIGDVTNNRPGACTASSPAWSPDGRQLAFLSDCSDASGTLQPGDQQNIFVWILAVNNMKQISHLHGEVGTPQWSPDGKSIAFLYVENATRQAGATSAMKPWSGVIGEDGVEVQRVAAIDAASGLGGWISADPKLHIYEFSWSPDSKQITYTAAAPPGENNWWVARLYVQSTGSIGSCVSLPIHDSSPCAGFGIPVGDPKAILNLQTIIGSLHNLQIAVPRFSPDGKQIAFIGGLMSDQGSTGGDIYTISMDGGQPRRFDTIGSAAWLEWLDGSPSHERIGYTAHWQGKVVYATTDYRPSLGGVASGSGVGFQTAATIEGGQSSLALSVSEDGHVAFVQSDFAHPPEVFAGCMDGRTNWRERLSSNPPPGDSCQPRQMTHLNDALKPAWGKSESIEYTNDGLHIQGWLLYPYNYDPAKKYPLIVSVHGGPSSAATPRWPTATYGSAPFSALGYFVFLPNPRGSFGQGEKFTQANVKDFGYGDLRDILAGVDLLEKRFPIDRDREGITGWSYGGFMTMFAVTQTTRFKAAVAGAGISNWQSYYGENSIDQWMIPFFGASVYDDPAVYAKSSAIDFIKQAKTPTLLLVGDRDGECPAPQSFEFWHALRDLGVKTQLVIYPNEGHHIADPVHQRDVLKRALDWFHTEMPPK